MRINSVSQSDAISKYMNAVNSKPVKGELKTEITDSVVLSEGAQKYASLLKSVKESVDKSSAAEEAKAADIMARMNSNTYKVQTEDVVKGIISGIPTHI
jgi:DNA-binding ferritin-like protein